MSLWWCPTCKDIQPNGTYLCPKCGAALQFTTVRQETDAEKAAREQQEMIEEALRMNF